MDYDERTKWIVGCWAHPQNHSKEEIEEARVAKQSLDDPGFLESIKNVFKGKSESRERSAAYDMLGALLLNTDSPEVGDFLLERLKKEKTKGLKKEILQAIYFPILRDKNIALKDAANVIDCLGDKMLLQPAIRALACFEDEAVEPALIEVVRGIMASPELKKTHNFYLALHSLSLVGTEASVAVAMEVIDNLPSLNLGYKGKIKSMALKILADHCCAANADLFAECLKNENSPHVTWHAMHALSKCATVDQADAIEQRLMAILSRDRFFVEQDLVFLQTAGVDKMKTELQLGLEILSRLGKLKSNTALLGILDEKEDVCTDEEKSCFRSFV